MLCPYKKITRYVYLRDVTHGVAIDNDIVDQSIEYFGNCDEFECPAYYEEVIFDTDDCTQHCRLVEKNGKDCN